MKCEFPYCRTVLSEFNEGKYCFNHQKKALDLEYLTEEEKVDKKRYWKGVQVTRYVTDISTIIHALKALKDCEPRFKSKMYKEKVKNKNTMVRKYAIYRYA